MKKRLGFDLIILGDSASGKDTQAELLMKKYDLSPVASGAYFRRLMKERRYEKILEKTYSKGLPAPTILMLGLLKESFEAIKSGQDFVFIGAARLKEEAEFLVKYLKRQKRDFFAIYIKLPKSVVIKRSLKRSRKEDHNPKFIANRFDYYKKEVSQTKQFYQKLGHLKFINGNQPVGRIAKDIQTAIHDYQQSQRNRKA